MKNILVFNFIVCFQNICLSQTRQPAGKLDINTAPNGIFEEIKELKSINSQGSYYLHNDWEACLIYLKNGQKGKSNSCKYNMLILKHHQDNSIYM